MKWLLILLIPTMSFAEELSISDFSGGLNTSDPSFRVAPGFSPYMRNVFVDDGKLEGIKGFEVLGTTNTLNKVTGIFPYRRDSGQTTFLVTDSSVTLETSDFVTYTFVSSGSNAGALLRWMQVREKMWGFNGVDFVRTWDGTTMHRLGLEANTPNVPKFKIGAYHQERVFGLNNPSGASDLDWSDTASTDGVKLEPDDVRSWPATNNRQIGEGDGQLGTALFVEDGQLRIGKERSIYTLYGTNASNYVARKEENIGDGVVSQESVLSLDGHVTWLGQDGIYESGRRVSDLIDDEVQTISKGSINTVENTWDTKSQFAQGQFFGTTVSAVGMLTLHSGIPSFAVTHHADFTTPGSQTLEAGSTFYGPIRIDFGSGFDGYRAYLSSYAQSHTSCDDKIKTTVYNLFTNVQHSTINYFPGSSPFIINFSSQSPVLDWTEARASSYAIKYELVEQVGGACTITASFGAFAMPVASTGQFVSDVATNTSITTWGLYDSLRNTNGGSIDYFVRSATTPFNISTQAWRSISPGSYVGEPTQNRFIQWAATFTRSGTSPSVDDVVIAHVEGVGSHNRPFAISWKNRYWLATSTTSSSELSLILVQSRITNKNPDAWMPIEGINIRSFAKNDVGDIFYAGASTWGAVYRMDFGTSFGGQPIRFVYDTPDMILGSNYNTKNILKYYLDAERDSGLNLSVMSSVDMGDYTAKTVSFAGSGRQRTVLKGVTSPAKTLRVRLTHSQLDNIFRLYDFTTEFETTKIVENPQ